MSHAHQVTVVVSTYNRPDPLRAALRSVQRQTFGDLSVIVIGDCCDERTRDVVDELGDGRFRYVNFKTRFGEQSGPNSVGLSLADSPFIAMLNHDDLWLPDHLDRAMDALQQSQADIYFAPAAFVCDLITDEHGLERPCIFRSTNGTELSRVFGSHFSTCEPCSAWVFKRSLFERVGNWSSAAELYRTPLVDWLLRAWRADAVAAFGTDLTVLKGMYGRARRPKAGGPLLYLQPGNDHLAVDELMTRITATEFRDRMILRSGSDRTVAQRAWDLARAVREVFRPLVFNRLLARLYWQTGWDVYSLYSVIRGRRRGWRLRDALRRRTGEELRESATIEQLVTEARAELEKSW